MDGNATIKVPTPMAIASQQFAAAHGISIEHRPPLTHTHIHTHRHAPVAHSDRCQEARKRNAITCVHMKLKKKREEKKQLQEEKT